jgi:hypothetical protein
MCRSSWTPRKRTHLVPNPTSTDSECNYSSHFIYSTIFHLIFNGIWFVICSILINGFPVVLRYCNRHDLTESLNFLYNSILTLLFATGPCRQNIQHGAMFQFIFLNVLWARYLPGWGWNRSISFEPSHPHGVIVSGGVATGATDPI